MAIIEIPLRNDLDHYEFSVDLDGKAYLFEIFWNTRNETWHLTIKSDDTTVLVAGIPLLVNSNLLERFELASLPPGVLSLLEISGSNLDAEKSDLGVRCILIYSEAA